MINLNEVGVKVSKDSAGIWQLQFGIYLPGITFDKGYTLKVKVIHEDDQFVPFIEPVDFWMDWQNGTPLDLWTKTASLSKIDESNFGLPGKYIYRYQLLKDNIPVVFWFSDPFAQDSAIGTFSSVVIEEEPHVFEWSDSDFIVPEIDKMVVYELNVREFNHDFDGIIARIPYLKGLGVNVLELMPVTNVKEDVEWGYTPMNYFAPDERFGGSGGLKRLVNSCHEAGIAVILDVVYAHAHVEFAYNYVYKVTREANPMMGLFAGEFFSDIPGTDFSKEFTRDYFFNVNKYYLNEFRVDGFRYDYVPGIYDGFTGRGYAELVFKTYQFSRAIARFSDPSRSRIIQCAEHLPAPTEIISKTYSNTCWQNSMLDKSREMLEHGSLNESFAHLLDPELSGYVTSYNGNNDQFPVAPFQYVETHDHRRFITKLPNLDIKDITGETQGNRSLFYKTQPYIIALYTTKGIPMLWQGQELVENWGMRDDGISRTLYERPIHWEYMYDRYGKAMITLYRRLGTIRKESKSLGAFGYFFYYFDHEHLNKKCIAYNRRKLNDSGSVEESLIIILNFSDHPQNIPISFHSSGQWAEIIDGNLNLQVNNPDERIFVTVPSNYGSIYKWSA